MRKQYIIYRVKYERGDAVQVEWWERTAWYTDSPITIVREMKEELDNLTTLYPEYSFVILPESTLETSLSVNRVHHIGGNLA